MPSCRACNELLDRYVRSARAYANATHELWVLLEAGLHGPFDAMRRVTARMRANCEIARKAFAAHRKRHKRGMRRPVKL